MPGEGKAGAAALRPGDEVAVIVHPRSVTLHAVDPGDREANVHRCEILQSIPVSADFSVDDGAMQGLMRVVMDLTPTCRRCAPRSGSAVLRRST